MQLDVEPALSPTVEAGRCPHLAMLLASYEQVAPALASFYALGAKRNGGSTARSPGARPRTAARCPRRASTSAGSRPAGA